MSRDDGQRSGRERRDAGERASGKERRSGADRRTEARIKKRIRCELVLGDKRLRGFVLDVSPRGLFVQSPKPIDPGTAMQIGFVPNRASLPRNGASKGGWSCTLTKWIETNPAAMLCSP